MLLNPQGLCISQALWQNGSISFEEPDLQHSMIKQSSQAVKTSVTNNSPFKGFLQPNNHSAQLSLAQTFLLKYPFLCSF